MEREVGGGIGMGNTCKPMSVSFQCMTKSNTHTQKKASRGEEISVELIKILKDDAVKVLHSMYQQIWKTHLWPQDWKMSVFISIQKKGNAKECSNYCKIVLAPLRLYSKSFKSGFNSP